MGVVVIALFGANLAFYGGVLIGEDAINVQKAAAARGVGPKVDSTLSPSERAEVDDSASLPGMFVASQGRQHLAPYPQNRRVPFCDPARISDDCYASNPPTSGLHLPVQGTVRLADGHLLKIPPDPDVYDFPVPREVIPHVEEHAGVYVGYNCSSEPCRSTVERLKDLVVQENSLRAKVIMSPDLDLDDDTIGLAAWTRVDTFEAGDYTDDRVRRFIKAYSCRFDPEGFCVAPSLN